MNECNYQRRPHITVANGLICRNFQYVRRLFLSFCRFASAFNLHFNQPAESLTNTPDKSSPNVCF